MNWRERITVDPAIQRVWKVRETLTPPPDRLLADLAKTFIYQDLADAIRQYRAVSNASKQSADAAANVSKLKHQVELLDAACRYRQRVAKYSAALTLAVFVLFKWVGATFLASFILAAIVGAFSIWACRVAYVLNNDERSLAKKKIRDARKLESEVPEISQTIKNEQRVLYAMRATDLAEIADSSS